MAEIKTCEQYVLWKLEEAEEKIAGLEEEKKGLAAQVKQAETVINVLRDLFEINVGDDGAVKFKTHEGEILTGRDPYAAEKIELLIQLFERKEEGGPKKEEGEA